MSAREYIWPYQDESLPDFISQSSTKTENSIFEVVFLTILETAVIHQAHESFSSIGRDFKNSIEEAAQYYNAYNDPAFGTINGVIEYLLGSDSKFNKLNYINELWKTEQWYQSYSLPIKYVLMKRFETNPSLKQAIYYSTINELDLIKILDFLSIAFKICFKVANEYSSVFTDSTQNEYPVIYLKRYSPKHYWVLYHYSFIDFFRTCESNYTNQYPFLNKNPSQISVQPVPNPINPVFIGQNFQQNQRPALDKTPKDLDIFFSSIVEALVNQQISQKLDRPVLNKTPNHLKIYSGAPKKMPESNTQLKKSSLFAAPPVNQSGNSLGFDKSKIINPPPYQANPLNQQNFFTSTIQNNPNINPLFNSKIIPNFIIPPGQASPATIPVPKPSNIIGPPQLPNFNK